MGEHSENEMPESLVKRWTRLFIVWKHLGIEKDSSGTAHTDKHTTCAQKVAHNGGTTNLKNDLKTNHQAEFEESYGNEQIANKT